MQRRELELRIRAFTDEQPVERTRIFKGTTSSFHVEMILKPRTGVTERFFVQLEAALGSELGTLSVIRLPREKLLVRFTVPPRYESGPDEAGRVEESCSYLWETTRLLSKDNAAGAPRLDLQDRRAVTYRVAAKRCGRRTPHRMISRGLESGIQR
jgi:hypothetical protein